MKTWEHTSSPARRAWRNHCPVSIATRAVDKVGCHRPHTHHWKMNWRRRGGSRCCLPRICWWRACAAKAAWRVGEQIYLVQRHRCRTFIRGDLQQQALSCSMCTSTSMRTAASKPRSTRPSTRTSRTGQGCCRDRSALIRAFSRDDDEGTSSTGGRLFQLKPPASRLFCASLIPRPIALSVSARMTATATYVPTAVPMPTPTVMHSKSIFQKWANGTRGCSGMTTWTMGTEPSGGIGMDSGGDMMTGYRACQANMRQTECAA
jgi:hypothetical protein